MSFQSITSALIGAGKANVIDFWKQVQTNFASHQSRLNALEPIYVPIPVGTIMEYGSAVAPTGFLECDGSAVSRRVYANLFSAIGSIYGAGDGATTFNLPDFRGRCAVGAGAATASTSARALGDKFGEETHVLSQNEIPAHSHVVTPGSDSHSHTLNGNTTAGGTGMRTNGGSVDYGSATSTTGITLQNAGTGTGHNNMQPYLCSGFFIKT